MKKIISLFLAVSMFVGFNVTTANAAKTLKCQTVISAKADEVVMLKDFGQTVTKLTGGSVKFEILPVDLLGLIIGQANIRRLCYLDLQ
jgi:TRAP-type C4-dicarboxylate transport system substrate-binding protein